MLIVEKQILIDLPLSESWEKVRDISLAANYIPNVERIEVVTSETEGVGASRKAYLKKGNKVVDETVIDWKSGLGFTLKLDVNGQRALPWFDEFHFRYRIEDADHQTLFKPAILYQPRCEFLIGLQKIAYDKILGRELNVICASMKSYYETNLPTSEARFNEIRQNL